MKLLYKFLVVIVLVGSSVPQASSDWDDASIGRIVRSLAHDPESLRIFLSRIAPSTRGSGEEGRPALAAASMDEIRSAQRRVLPTDQVTLTAADISGNPGVDSRDIFEIDLNDMHEANLDSVVAYFNAQPLCSLRWLKLPAGDLAHALVEAIFTEDDAQRKYISLHHIVAQNNNFMEADLDRVFEHFSGYKDFVRDMSQISGRYDCVAAFLAVNGVGHLADGSEYARGRKDEGGHTVHYRVGEAPTEDAPFIMSARPFR